MREVGAASSKIGRSAAKPNVARTGWLIVNGNGNAPTTAPDVAAEDPTAAGSRYPRSLL